MESDLAWLADAQDFGDLFRRADIGVLAPDEVGRFEIHLVRYLRIREFAWFQYLAGILDERTWESYLRPTAGVFASEQAKEYWQSKEYAGDPEFVEYLDQWMQEQGIIP